MDKRKRIAITMGDPAGIGPEVTLKALMSKQVGEVCLPVVIGDRVVLEAAAEELSIGYQLNEGTNFIEVSAIAGRDFPRNEPSAVGGRASVAYIRKAVELALKGEVDAVVTAPITKEALKIAGFTWPGHTEMLAELTGTADYAMMLSGGPLRIILATIHTALKDVPVLITQARVLKTIRFADSACKMMGITHPRIAVAGLNPHAGEAGLFGHEERDSIIPAVKAAAAEGIAVSGPYPADTLFYKAYKGEFDIVVCMYHDQGLIPLKMIAFDSGVNVTVGLPIIRTSPDHGTAYDIAWQGKADPASMIEAIKLATVLRASNKMTRSINQIRNGM
jgi:4-hydroxythreonine-4-phosphate dehydrogenase